MSIGVIIILCVHDLQYFLVGPDIAFNKPANASSTHNNDRNMYGPQLVNNGKAICDNPSGPIAHTLNEDNPWFKVYLRGTFNIKTVAVLPRTSKFSILKFNIK